MNDNKNKNNIVLEDDLMEDNEFELEYEETIKEVDFKEVERQYEKDLWDTLEDDSEQDI